MGWVKDLGPTEWAGSLSADFFRGKRLSELSIFVDESGSNKYSRTEMIKVYQILSDQLKGIHYECR